MAWEDYPFPTPPADLGPPLGRVDPCTIDPCVLGITSDPTDPTRAVVRAFAWKDVSSIVVYVDTPGYLRVRLNGVEVVTASFWDYTTQVRAFPWARNCGRSSVWSSPPAIR